MTATLEHAQHSFNMSSSSNINKMTPLFDWGINLSYEDHVNRHVPSGEHNHLVASIIQAEQRGDKFIKASSDTPYDLPLCIAQNLVKEKEATEKRLLATIQKVKDELSQFTESSEAEAEAEAEAGEEEEDDGPPEVDVRGAPREKSGKPPKWAQNLKSKKEKAEEMKRRKALMSSLKTQSDSLAELRKEIVEQRITLSKQEALREAILLLHKGLLGAERSYRDSHDQEFLVKNVHHNMKVWETKSKPLLPPPKMVERLVGSPGAFKTVMVPQNQREIVPLSEFLRKDW